MINDWLTLLCQLLPGVKRAIVVRQQKQSVMAHWPDGQCQSDDLIAGVQAQPLSDDCTFVAQPDSDDTWVFYKIVNNKMLLGTLCLELPLSPRQYDTTERLIIWSSAWLDLIVKNNRERAAGFENILSVLTQATALESLQENSYTLATTLSKLYGFSQVIICMQYKGKFVTQAVSNVLAFERKAEQFYLLEKSLGRKGAALSMGAEFSHWLHIQKPLLNCESIALVHNGQCYGAIVCLWPSGRKLDSQTLAQLNTIARHIGPIYASQAKLKEPLIWRSYHRWQRYWQSLNKNQKALFYIAPLCLVLISVFVPVSHKVKGEANLEGEIQRAIVAPEDGYLSQADVKAGEVLQKGQVLALLDQKSILLEIKRWQSEKQEYEGQYNRELNALNHTQMQIAKSKMAQAEAKLELYKQRLQRLTITAPIDGVVIKGDLSRALGTPVERGQVLYEMAPVDAFKLVIMVPEKDIRYLTTGQSGRLILSAYANDKITFKVISVASVFAEQKSGVYYRVEAELTQTHNQLRPGMSGIAKISVGRKPLGWVLIKPLWNWLRLKLWAF